MIYLDNAATSNPKPDCVIEAVTRAMKNFGNSGRAAHGQAMDAARTIYETREKIAELFHCSRPQNVIFTSNATEALNIAIFGLINPGDHVISTDLEHNSVLRPLYSLMEKGVEVDFLAANEKGCIDYSDFEKFLKPNTKFIICTHASNLTGNLLDLEWIGKFSREHNLIFIVDASQTAGSIPIDMELMNIDVLCFTGHKALLGPQGTGGLCVKDGLKIRTFKCGGTGVQTYLKKQPEELPTHLEAGTLNGHGIAGLLEALNFIERLGIENIHAQEINLMRKFYEGVKKIPGIKIYGDFSSDRAPILSLNFKDMPSGELADILAEEFSIATRPGAHCAPRMHEALGTVEQGAVRFSFGYANTEQDVELALKALRSICL